MVYLFYLSVQILHYGQTLSSVTIPEVIPMVEVVEQLVELTPGFEALLFWNCRVIGLVKVPSESSEHLPDGKIVFVMAVETGGIKNHRLITNLGKVAAPEVAV